MNMPPRWGFSSFGAGGYNDVAFKKLVTELLAVE